MESDYQTLYASWKDYEVVSGYNWRIPYAFDGYCDKLKNDNNWGAVIIRLQDHQVIGRIGISAGLPDLTITVFPLYRNQKYGTQAFSLGVQYCFEVLKLKRIYAGCFEDNFASRKMIEQCGFRRNPKGDVMESHIVTGEERLQLDFVIENPNDHKNNR